MNEEKEKNSFGILKSLKKLIFEDEPAAEASAPAATPAAPAAPEVRNPATYSQTPPPLPITASPATDVKQMKIKVLEMLEKLNEPGVDFFEVWNAAAEMGAVDANTLKAAFTSLKYVDKTLTKEKLTATGKRYADQLQDIISRETTQKQQQKQSVEQQQVKEKESLVTEIQELERKLNELRQQLDNKQKDLREINGKYEPQLRDIDNKIAIGNNAVAEVIADIRKALDLIESNII
ncbi:hypothetical protein CLV59_107195 [Chitinophaga dinghuensis]|uniref:Uncharacterized protein n=1 Tax=Chitinophaga dinghuensis TaxID=1539050 RepID=A0A327VTZ8_9BACT|nr:hypothetical protein [Chitinophaga dinghuensis]RAJ77428.1 hypothetical protein CLV59_107195 [Chitinophaga dinghuensis]